MLFVAGIVIAGIELLSGERYWSVVPTGKGAIDQAISPDETILVVLNAGENSLSFLDLKSKIPFGKLYLPLPEPEQAAEGEEPSYLLESVEFSGDGSRIFVTCTDGRYFVVDPVLLQIVASGELCEGGLLLSEKGRYGEGILALEGELGKLSFVSEEGELPILFLGAPFSLSALDLVEKKGCTSCSSTLFVAFQEEASSALTVLRLSPESFEVLGELRASLPEGALLGDIQRGEGGFLLGVFYPQGAINLLWLADSGELEIPAEPTEAPEGQKIFRLSQSGIFITNPSPGLVTLATYDKEGEPIVLDLKPCGFDGVKIRSFSSYPKQADSFAAAVGPHQGLFGVSSWEGVVVFDSSGQEILGLGNNNNACLNCKCETATITCQSPVTLCDGKPSICIHQSLDLLLEPKSCCSEPCSVSWQIVEQPGGWRINPSGCNATLAPDPDNPPALPGTIKVKATIHEAGVVCKEVPIEIIAVKVKFEFEWVIVPKDIVPEVPASCDPGVCCDCVEVESACPTCADISKQCIDNNLKVTIWPGNSAGCKTQIGIGYNGHRCDLALVWVTKATSDGGVYAGGGGLGRPADWPPDPQPSGFVEIPPYGERTLCEDDLVWVGFAEWVSAECMGWPCNWDVEMKEISELYLDLEDQFLPNPTPGEIAKFKHLLVDWQVMTFAYNDHHEWGGKITLRLYQGQNPDDQGRVRIYWSPTCDFEDSAEDITQDCLSEEGFVLVDTWVPMDGNPNYPVCTLEYWQLFEPFRIVGEQISSRRGDVKLEVTITPPEDSPDSDPVTKSLKVTVVNVDIDVDTNRDGTIDSEDEEGEDSWTKQRGALFLVNCDDDDNDGWSDSIEYTFEHGYDVVEHYVNLIFTREDLTINGQQDCLDITPLLIQKMGPLDDVSVELRFIDNDNLLEDVRAIHVFGCIQAGAQKIFGGPSETRDRVEIKNYVSSDQAKELGLEGLYFANSFPPDRDQESIFFDGLVELELVLITPGGRELKDRVALKVAPWILLANDRPTQSIYAVNDSENQEFREALSASGNLVTYNPDPSNPYDPNDQWAQDHVQIGFSETPRSRMHVALILPRTWPFKYNGSTAQASWPYSILLAPDVGVFRVPETHAAGGIYDERFDSGDFGGNIEGTLPNADWGLGRIVVGSTISTELFDFFKLQGAEEGIQEPFKLNTDWLAVGHIDEFFVTGEDGSIYVADTSLALTLLQDGPDAPPEYAVFFATGSNVVSSTAGGCHPNRLYDGPAFGDIFAVGPDSLQDGETFTVGDGITLKTFEFEKAGGVSPGNIEVNLTGCQSATDVRNTIVEAINGSGLNIAADPDPFDGSRVWLRNKAKGSVGNVPIQDTVQDQSFMHNGMAGGKDDGMDFTGVDWKFVRIYKGSGAGQTAQIKVRHDGWLEIESVWDTKTDIVPEESQGDDIPPCFYKWIAEPYAYAPKQPTWFSQPDNTSGYVLVKGTKFWIDPYTEKKTPAIVTVKEVLEDNELITLQENIQEIIDGEISKLEAQLGETPSFVYVPVIYVADRPKVKVGDSYYRTALAFTPDAANFKPSQLKAFFARQHGPLNAEGKDVLEESVKDRFQNAGNLAPVSTEDWDLYHRYHGEVHCGVAAKREIKDSPKWWEVIGP